jgi:hypothetical protein
MLKEKTAKELIAESLTEQELRGPDFLTYVARPKHVEHIETWSDLSPDGGAGTAIIVHGPMVYESHFTRDTIRLYRKHYPKTLIILSTWDDEDDDYLEEMRDQQLRVIINKKPQHLGRGDSELTRIPSHAGIAEANARGVSHILLTRTDHRLCAPNLIEYFRSLQNCFPIDTALKQTERIIVSAYGTRKYIPFWFNAYVMFGHITDMSRYWDDVADLRSKPAAGPIANSIQWHLQNYHWHYFATKYLRKTEISFEASQLQDSWRVLTDLFCLVDKEMLDLYWKESADSRFLGQERRVNVYNMQIGQLMTFRDWFLLYQNKGRISSAPNVKPNATSRDLVRNSKG